MRVFGNLAASMSTPEMQALEAELAPLIAEHTDAIRLDPRLFARLDAVHAARHDAGLTPEQVRVVERYHRDFVRAGAALPDADRETLRSLNVQITSLTTEFGTRVLAESNDLAVHVADRAELDGLSANAVEAAAQRRGVRRPGRVPAHAVAAHHPAGHLLAHRPRRPSPAARGRDHPRHPRRRRTTPASWSARISRLRAERAALLGFADHAAYVADDQTAGTHQGGRWTCSARWSARRWPTSRSSARRIEELLAADGVDGPVRAVGLGLLRRAVRRPRRTTWTPTRCGRTSSSTGCCTTGSSSPPLCSTASRSASAPTCRSTPRRPRLRGPRRRRQHARAVRLRLVRPAHQAGGAWMDEFVGQSRLLGTRPVVVVCLNVPQAARRAAGADDRRRGAHRVPRVRPRAARPVLRRASTRGCTGTAVPATSWSSPRQVNEMWAWWPEVLANYAVHHETGEPLAAGRRRPADRLPGARPGLRDGRDARRRAARPGVAPAHRRAPASPRSRAFEAAALGGTGSALRPGAAALPDARTSRTSSPAATTRATTPTSGARSSTPTRSSGSRRTAA